MKIFKLDRKRSKCHKICNTWRNIFRDFILVSKNLLKASRIKLNLKAKRILNGRLHTTKNRASYDDFDSITFLICPLLKTRQKRTYFIANTIKLPVKKQRLYN